MAAAVVEEAGAEQVEGGSKPNYQLIGIVIGVVGVVAAAGIGWFMVKPAWEKYQAQTETLAELDQKIKTGATRKDAEEKAKAQRAIALRQKEEVTALFASEKALETLLLDVNRIVQMRNAEMELFEPSKSGPPEVISDGSLGPLVNGKIKQKEMNMRLTGSFDQIRSVLLTMERLQPLLVVTDLSTKLDRSTQEVSYNAEEGLTISGTPKLQTSLTIQALMPTELESADAEPQKK
ncbi:MAG: GspMb/PilO family protein [Hormoscilla sp.]